VRVLTAAWGWYPDDINSKLEFDEFAKPSPDAALYVGISCTEEPSILHHMKNFKRKVYLNLEHPCTLYAPPNKAGFGAIEQQTIFDEVYTICPYTAEWLNSLGTSTTFRAIPYPHNLKYDIYHDVEKVYDVAYCGLIHNEEIASYIEAIKTCKYFFSTLTGHNRVSSVDHLATHNNIPNTHKWELLARSRSAIIQNNLYLHPHQVALVKQLPSWETNAAFSHLDSGLLPQLKSRTVEAAICKSLMLVKKDPWNVIEYWFTPDEDFIYFENPEDLSNKVKEVNSNWEKYQDIVESAYNKVITKYNTKYIFEKIRQGEEVQ
jgi:spore maturation protein CgeB